MPCVALRLLEFMVNIIKYQQLHDSNYTNVMIKKTKNKISRQFT